ncbi:flagellar MS-ring protein [Pirellula sp. SH-Sr6A]|uniref:flagellar M-ring protein FliF C-terminal domain-containing protein n=1 Tax=Pirellula sp. SH-Sr6A TaxID=1632865 RepID=UPI00078D5AA0|nr:flagellar M-ring protein FliF C-terminal domain-containing protein [Pirellula sp. SH-Sr6A]AMV33794.1 flagellar MS-ring protein [Pirellula sp. SH-Sr6A]
MNQLTKLSQQLQTLFAGMTAQARVLAVLLVAAIAASVGMLATNYRSGSGETTYLFDGESFSEEQLSRFEMAFSAAGLREWDRVGYRIQIPAANKTEYLKAVAEAKVLPGGLHSQLDEALKESNFLESTRTTEAKQLSAKLSSISRSLETMPFVHKAFVTFDEKREGFSSKRPKVASIAILPRHNTGLTNDQSRSIMQYVQKSIAGLGAADIALLDLSTGQTRTGEDDPLALEQERYYQIKKQREQDLKRRAQQLLTDYGNVRIEVNVDIDPTLGKETSNIKYDPKPTTVQSSTSKRDSDLQKMGPGGRPGTEPNALANRSASISPTPEQINKEKESTESSKQVVGSTLSTIREAGLQTKQVSFSILLPFSYYRTAYLGEWMQLNPDKKTEDAPPFDEATLATVKQKVEANVKSVLTAIVQTSVEGEAKVPNITVSHYVDFPGEEIAGPSVMTQTVDWLQQSWQTLMLAAIALAAIVSMRSFAKTAPSTDDRPFENGFDIPIDDAIDLNLTSLTGDDDELGSGASNSSEPGVPPKFKITGGDLKGNLTTMVRENPDAAATLLRNWIGGTQT